MGAKAQISCGITIPTYGEQRRENYVHYQCRNISVFDFENLEHRIKETLSEKNRHDNLSVEEQNKKRFSKK